MEQIPWFDRTFQFNGRPDTFPSLLERLEGTPLRLHHKIHTMDKTILKNKVNGKWSIQEHVGHLIDLEPVWQGRLADILNGEKYLRAADLENKATDQAGHNDHEIDDLLDRFLAIRTETMTRLRNLSMEDLLKSGLHPRLEIPMSINDLFLFVAEHDDHHLASMHSLGLLS